MTLLYAKLTRPYKTDHLGACLLTFFIFPSFFIFSTVDDTLAHFAYYTRDQVSIAYIFMGITSAYIAAEEMTLFTIERTVAFMQSHKLINIKSRNKRR